MITKQDSDKALGEIAEFCHHSPTNDPVTLLTNLLTVRERLDNLETIRDATIKLCGIIRSEIPTASRAATLLAAQIEVFTTTQQS